MIPKGGSSNQSKLEMQVRLINQEEEDFIVQTLTLMAIGFVLIVILLVVVFKSMGSNRM